MILYKIIRKSIRKIIKMEEKFDLMKMQLICCMKIHVYTEPGR